MGQMFTEDEVQKWDLRRQQQIKNQIESIDRLLGGEATYDSEMAILHQKLAEAQAENANLVAQIKSLLED